MAREKKVVDASIMVKWFVNETGTEEALKLRDEHISGKITLIIPDFAFLEVINALRYKRYDEEALKKANESLWDIQPHTQRLNESLLYKASQLALTYDLSLYDALYLAVAVLLGVPLITADEKLSKVPSVVLLK